MKITIMGESKVQVKVEMLKLFAYLDSIDKIIEYASKATEFVLDGVSLPDTSRDSYDSLIEILKHRYEESAETHNETSKITTDE